MGAALAAPLALGGLVLVAVLVAVYVLQSRSRPLPVSNLLLWEAIARPIREGAHLQRLQAPLLFFLELAAIVLLVLAAAGPLIPGSAAPAIVVVLDDSYSMQAGGSESPRAAALEHLRDILREPMDVHFLLAGARAGLLGRAVRLDQALGLLDSWTCRASAAALEAALVLAAEVAPGASVLVLTDHAPPRPPDPGIRWSAFGRPRGNLAFLNATRRSTGGVQRVLLEAINYSDEDTTAPIAVHCPPEGPARMHTLELPAGGRGRILLELPEEAPALQACLPADALAIDDRALLAPEEARPVRVRLFLGDQVVAELVSRAVDASGLGRIVGREAELIVADRPVEADPEAWRLEILDRPDAVAYAGPFLVDRGHPIVEGLVLAGVIWPASPAEPLAGTPIVSAGDVVLLAQTGRGRTLRMHFRPELSTLGQQPAWPVLIHNLLRWRRSALPGPLQPNLRLDAVARITLPPGADSAAVRCPMGQQRRIQAKAGEAALAMDRPGLYRIESDGLCWTIGCNALGDEGDLRACAAGQWGRWTSPGAGGTYHYSLAPAGALAALALIAIHMYLLARQRAGGTP